jgi:hypothetical protein
MRAFTFLIGLLVLAAMVGCTNVPPTQIVLVVTATPSPEGAQAAQAGTPATAMPTPEVATPTPDIFPTPFIGQMYIAEQPFERGKMLWLQPNQQIWVISTDADGVNLWTVYEDTFVEGELEFDESIVPPSEALLQPVRGFGKLWRENPAVRDALGWATRIELGHVTRYTYNAGGTVVDNEYIEGDNYHTLQTLDKDVIAFIEGQATWRIIEN